MNLKVAKKIEIKESPGKGYGVFAIEDIEENEIIEECHLLKVYNRENPSRILEDYAFSWPRGNAWTESVIPLGYGCIYNHSENPNANWKDHSDTKAFQFFAIKKILAGEEICTYYGGSNYWDDKQKKVEII